MKFIEIHSTSIKLDMVCFLVNCNVAVLFRDDEFDEGFLDDSWTTLETSGHSHCDHLAPICYHIQHNLLDK